MSVLRQYIEAPAGYRLANLGELQPGKIRGIVGVYLEWVPEVVE